VCRDACVVCRDVLAACHAACALGCGEVHMCRVGAPRWCLLVLLLLPMPCLPLVFGAGVGRYPALHGLPVYETLRHFALELVLVHWHMFVRVVSPQCSCRAR
jgi:hypothetical protein